MAKNRDEIIDVAKALEGLDVKRERLTNIIVRDSLKEFGRYTIEDRALPKVFDGLKPSQRRILWSMHLLKAHSTAVPIKCARIIGDAMGRFHPHGDQSLYGTLVNLAFSRSPLVDPASTNFGNDKGLAKDPPAAMRYTECRLTKFGDRFFDDIDIMPLVKNFTEEFDEPPILPARVPIVLANGCSGIALGIATNIPPHNLKDLIETCLYFIEHKDCTPLDLAKVLKGPDYGEGSGTCTSKKRDLYSLYVVGEGRVEYECSWHIEQSKKTSKLIITGKAPNFSTNKLITVTTSLASSKLLVAPVNDESSMTNPTRLTIEFTDYSIIRDRILPLLKTKESYRFNALDEDSKPHKYDLLGLIESFIEFRRVIEKKVLLQKKEDLEKKLGTDEAKVAAINNLDWVVKVLKTSKSVDEALKRLSTKLHLELWQAEVILNSQIRSLMRLNIETLSKHIEELNAAIAVIKKDLSQIDVVVARRLQEMLAYATPRAMPLGKAANQAATENLAAQTPSFKYLAIGEQGKVDRFEQVPLKSKAAWNYVDFLRATDPLLIVTDDNKAQKVEISYLDKASLGHGSKVVGVIPLSQVAATVVVSRDGKYVAFPSSIKKKKLQLFKTVSKWPIIRAVGLNKGDLLIVRWEGGDSVTLGLDALRVSRANIAPRPLPDGPDDDTKVTNVFVLKKGHYLVDALGNELEGAGTLPKKRKVFVVGSANIVVLTTGARVLKTSADMLDFLEKVGKTVIDVIPLPLLRKQPHA